MTHTLTDCNYTYLWSWQHHLSLLILNTWEHLSLLQQAFTLPIYTAMHGERNHHISVENAIKNLSYLSWTHFERNHDISVKNMMKEPIICTLKTWWTKPSYLSWKNEHHLSLLIWNKWELLSLLQQAFTLPIYTAMHGERNNHISIVNIMRGIIISSLKTWWEKPSYLHWKHDERNHHIFNENMMRATIISPLKA